MRTLTTLCLTLFLAASSFTSEEPRVTEVSNVTINWYSLEEAIQAQQNSPRKIFIDVYTDWCGWCKVMDNKTFTDKAVIEYMNENFYAVKFDAEQRDEISFKNKAYRYIGRGTKGINELALDLLDMQPSYPAFVILDEGLNKVGLFKGYSQPDGFITKVDALLNTREN